MPLPTSLPHLRRTERTPAGVSLAQLGVGVVVAVGEVEAAAKAQCLCAQQPVVVTQDSVRLLRAPQPAHR